MFPMSFEEFLQADDGKKYLELSSSREKDVPIPELCAVPLEKAFRNYLIVGGMPAVVRTWCETHQYEEAELEQDRILEDYAADFSKHAPPAEVPKIHWVWDSVPKQLAKENNKFIFSHVREGKRAAELENALIWLKDAGLVYQTELVQTPSLPLSFCADAASFKVYMADVGLLRRKAGVYYRTILEGDDGFTGFKGALTENYVQNQLKTKGYEPFYWRSGNQAELDFLIESRGKIVPIEVKSATNTMAKSYRQFCRKYNIQTGFKLSLKNIGVNEENGTTTVSLPLYLIQNLERYL
jgi:predicted AAA+ superfamily ATPase